ncbi:MAG: oligosaccharide flippase family protein [Candidatus Dactylopiibacterium sp.]|nr:oligosaccharide flippase family protein [Candidatus Dactylopiibacterium sp.]
MTHHDGSKGADAPGDKTGADDASATGLTARTAQASAWVIGTRLATKGIDFCSLLILARLLGPEQFGLVAMAMTAVLVVEAVLELPLSTALVRVRTPTEAMFDTAFTLSLLRGALVALLLLAAAWGLTRFYHEPRLFALICTLALAPVMRGLVSPRMVIYALRFDFRREFVMELAGKSLAFVIAVGVAWRTGSYWALALGTVTTPLVMMIVSQFMAPQRPRWCLSEWRVFADMTGWNTLSQIFAVVCWQADRIVLGRYTSPAVLGRYGIASDLANLPMQAIGQQVMRPLAVALVQIKEPERARQAYAKAAASLLFAVAPMLACLAAFAEPAVLALLGEPWLPAAELLHYLALIAILGLVVAPSAPLAMVHDRMRLNTLRVAGEALVKLPLMLILVPQWQVQGALVAHALGTFVGTAIALGNVRNLIGIGVFRQLRLYARTALALLPLALAAIALEAVLPARGLALWPALILKGAVCVGLYVLTAWALWRGAGRPHEGEGWLFLALEARARQLVSRRGAR